jgi:hypothetical protein
MPTIAEKILGHADTLPEGALISAKQFLHLGTRAAVDQALKRLQERKGLMGLAEASTSGPSRRVLERERLRLKRSSSVSRPRERKPLDLMVPRRQTRLV